MKSYPGGFMDEVFVSICNDLFNLVGVLGGSNIYIFKLKKGSDRECQFFHFFVYYNSLILGYKHVDTYLMAFV